MSSIKLKHASGNGVSISAPSSNPTADRTLELPGDADGIIAKTDASGNLAVTGDLTVDTDTLKVDSSNNRVGINTSSPDAKLKINGASAYTVANSGQSVEGLDIKASAGGNGNFGGAISLGSSGSGRSAIAALQDGTDSDRTGLVFITHDSNTAAADSEEKMRLDSNGKLGIGKTPALPLDVAGANDTTFDHVGTLSLQGTDAYNSGNAGAGINFSGIFNSSGSVTTLAQISGIKADTGDGTFDGALTFGVRNDAEGVNIERARVTSDGQLLIGTTSFNDTREMLRIKNTTGDGTFLTIEAPSDTGSCHIMFGDSDFNEGRISYHHFTNKMEFTTNDADRMQIDSSGNIGAPSGSNIYNASDQRVKKNIVTLDKGLTSINSLRPVSFNWIDGFCDAEKETLYGFIAQEVQNVDPNLISQFGSNGTVEIGEEKIENTLRVNEKFITPILVKAIQELSAKVTTLETENAKLQTDLTSLTARVVALEAA